VQRLDSEPLWKHLDFFFQKEKVKINGKQYGQRAHCGSAEDRTVQLFGKWDMPG
jgi:hypothetical protein